jgi:hypothetical protein
MNTSKLLYCIAHPIRLDGENSVWYLSHFRQINNFTMLEAIPIKEGPEQEHFCVIEKVTICPVKEFLQLKLSKQEMEKEREMLFCLPYQVLAEKEKSVWNEFNNFSKANSLLHLQAKASQIDLRIARHIAIVENASVRTIDEILQLNLSKQEMEKERKILYCTPYAIRLDGENSVWGGFNHFCQAKSFAHLQIRVSKIDARIEHVAIFKGASIYIKGKGGELNPIRVEFFYKISFSTFSPGKVIFPGYIFLPG